MRAVIQRVTSCKVEVEGMAEQQIGTGLLVLLGIASDDTDEDIFWLARKLVALRIFADSNGLMNCSINDLEAELMVVSQFTLFAQTKKGNRPSFMKSAPPELAEKLYEGFIQEVTALSPKPVRSGYFGKHMKISLLNDGPVTIIIDTKNKE